MGQQEPQLVSRMRIWVKKNVLDLGRSHGTGSSVDRVAAGIVFRTNMPKKFSEPHRDLKTVFVMVGSSAAQ